MRKEADTRAPRPRELRDFGLLLGALFAAVFGVIPILRHRPTHPWPWALAAALWIVALAWPRGLTFIYRGWTRLGQLLGWFNKRVILTVLYALIIVPTGVAMRLFRRDRMGRRFEPARKSYRVAARNRAEKDMEKPF